MKNISVALTAHLSGELTTLAELVRITRADNVVVALTTHDVDIVWDGVTYKADGAFSPTKLTQGLSHRTKDYAIEGILDSAALSDDDIRNGLYDHARVDVYICNWADLSQGAVQVRRGWLGEVALDGHRYVASLRSLHDLLTRKIGETYTPECRYDLGEARCGMNVAALAVVGNVTSATDSRHFVDTGRSEAAGVFNHAKLTWTSGANMGVGVEVSAFDEQAFTLWLPMPHAIAVGDAYSVAMGCDKRFATCAAWFNNAVNYGGFPHLPGLGKILAYPDNR